MSSYTWRLRAFLVFSKAQTPTYTLPACLHACQPANLPTCQPTHGPNKTAITFAWSRPHNDTPNRQGTTVHSGPGAWNPSRRGWCLTVVFSKELTMNNARHRGFLRRLKYRVHLLDGVEDRHVKPSLKSLFPTMAATLNSQDREPIRDNYTALPRCCNRQVSSLGL